ncbi:hypothetical protein L7F22_054388 [Adiantum nelumboides]|nr:hypothetical protein [Adiantum nelumboides]
MCLFFIIAEAFRFPLEWLIFISFAILMSSQGLPVDLNDAWMEKVSFVPSSMGEFDSQLDDDCNGGLDAIYKTMTSSSTTPLCNIVAKTIPNGVLQSSSGHNTSLSDDERPLAWRCNTFLSSLAPHASQSHDTTISLYSYHTHMAHEEGGISVRARDRWLWVMEMCRDCGVCRSKDQCKSKYERVHGLYVRIRDYERRIPSRCNSYWQMDNVERRQKGLPTEEFPMVLYAKMENLFGNKRNVDVSGLLSDSFDNDNHPTGDEEVDTMDASEGVDPLHANDLQTPSNQHTGEQNRCTGATKATSADGESGGVKRKRRKRASTMKDVAKSTRKLVSHIETSKDRKDSKNEGFHGTPRY